MNFRLRHPQLAKELRPLQWPWIGAVVAGGLLTVRALVDDFGLGSLLQGLVVYGFFGGLALLAACSFGEEFQERTLSLVLTQPLDRSRLWKQKVTIVAAAVAAAIVADLVIFTLVSPWYSDTPFWEAVAHVFSAPELVLAGMFILATVCSSGYWTLVAGSTVGGLVFTVASQLVVALGITLACTRLAGEAETFQSSAAFPALVVAGVLYSALLLWLGRRKFLSLEVKNARWVSASRVGSVVSVNPARLGLVSRGDSPVLNLVRKELRLEKPAFQLAGLLVVCWIGVILLQWLRPKEPVVYLFDVLACLYAPITSLLAGCLSLGEEKALGLVDAQLTLPLSSAFQWLVKVLVCASSALLLSLGLPLLLLWGTGAILDLSHSGLMNPNDHGMPALACICGVAFMLALWGITHVANTVRAAIVAVVGAIITLFCLLLGAWCASRSGGLLIVPLAELMCRAEVSPDFMVTRGIGAVRNLEIAMALVIVLVMLYQSLSLFRRGEHPGRKFVIHALVVAALVAGTSFLAADFTTALQQLPNSRPVVELRQALNGIVPTEPGDNRQVTRTVLPSELEKRLSNRTKAWLRGTEITYQRIRTPNPDDSTYAASVVFPNGSSFTFIGGFVANRFNHGRTPAW